MPKKNKSRPGLIHPFLWISSKSKNVEAAGRASLLFPIFLGRLKETARRLLFALRKSYVCFTKKICQQSHF